MPKTTIVIGLLLIVLGLGSYFGAANGWLAGGHTSPTALIPTWFGIVLMICGVVALNPAMLKHGMHAAAAVALLGFIGALIPIGIKVAKGTIAANAAAASQAIMAALCALFVALAVRSFIQIRRQRNAAKG